MWRRVWLERCRTRRRRVDRVQTRPAQGSGTGSGSLNPFLYLVGAFVLVALAGCGGGWFCAAARAMAARRGNSLPAIRPGQGQSRGGTTAGHQRPGHVRRRFPAQGCGVGGELDSRLCRRLEAAGADPAIPVGTAGRGAELWHVPAAQRAVSAAVIPAATSCAGLWRISAVARTGSAAILSAAILSGVTLGLSGRTGRSAVAQAARQRSGRGG